MHPNAPLSDAQATKYYDWLFSNLHAGLGAGRSAEALAPVIVDLLRPKSVVDIGCGVGSWLLAFQAEGVHDTLGVDGTHLDRRHLRLPPEKIVTADLRERLELGRRFDLALCLEVAGYMQPGHTETLVHTLADAAPVVLFSSAIPLQDGEGIQPSQHWPEYWAELFLRRHFLPVDLVRKTVWGNDDIAWWYRQNTILYVHEGYLKTNERLRQAWERDPGPPARLVHPQHYLQLQSQARRGVVPMVMDGLKSGLARRLPPGVKAILRGLREKPSRAP